jgi:hypothetical protein
MPNAYALIDPVDSAIPAQLAPLPQEGTGVTASGRGIRTTTALGG